MEPGQEKCDFCSMRPIVWYYHVIPLPIVGSMKKNIYADSDDWTACAECKAAIDSDDRDALLERAIRHLPRQLQSNRTIRMDLSYLHDQFFSVKNGPGMSLE